MKVKYLDRRCPNCDAWLTASIHESPSERKKRDAKKVYCGPVCGSKHRAKSTKNVVDNFLYAKPMEAQK